METLTSLLDEAMEAAQEIKELQGLLLSVNNAMAQVPPGAPAVTLTVTVMGTNFPMIPEAFQNMLADQIKRLWQELASISTRAMALCATARRDAEPPPQISQ